MLIADTNILSELMRPQPSLSVSVWLTSAPEPIYTTAVCRAEIMVGIATLPAGRKRDALTKAAVLLFDEDFDGLLLSFDAAAADAFAGVVATRRRIGRPIQTLDAQIAGIVIANRGTLVTRNVPDFHRLRLRRDRPLAAVAHRRYRSSGVAGKCLRCSASA